MMDKPDYGIAEKCITIRKRSKRGEFITEEEHQLCGRLCDKYREWYMDTEHRVFNETVPFGSGARR